MAASDGGAPVDGGAGGGAREAFERATTLAARDPAAAAAAFEEVARRFPDDDWAADALLEAAELSEERLARPDRARALYQELLDRHPNSRLAIRARARRDFLAENLRSGVGPLAEYQDILQRYSTRPRAESVARMERLLAEHPDFPLADRAALWLAANARQAGDLADAERRYREIERRRAGTPVEAEAMRGRAEVVLERGRALEARRLYRALEQRGDPLLTDVARRGVAAAERALSRFIRFLLALALLVAFVAAVLVAAGAGAPGPVLAALALIGAGGAVIVWASAVASARRLERGPLTVRARSLSAAATALAVLCLGYAAVYATGTLDFVVETMRSGAER